MTCPSCGATYIRRRGWSGMFAMIAGVETQLASWECRICGFAAPEEWFERASSSPS